MDTILKAVAFATALMLLAACQTTSGQREISSYPEARTYVAFINGNARLYSSQQGSPVDLAFAAYASCRGERDEMERALRKDNSNTFVNEFMRQNRHTMIEIATEAIVRSRV